jgi:hypothetical protein
MTELDISVMNTFWKRIILKRRMQIISTNCNPRYDKAFGGKGFLVTPLNDTPWSDTYGVKMEKFEKRQSTPYDPSSIIVLHHLRIGYVVPSTTPIFNEITGMGCPVESFCHFRFDFEQDHQIHCQMICAYQPSKDEEPCITDRYGFWIDGLSEEDFFKIKEIAEDYEKQFKWIRVFEEPLE